MATLHSRRIAEHLNTFASLLEAEAIRANTLGLKGSKDLVREAMNVRSMANQLWDADTAIALERPVRSVAVAQAMNERSAAKLSKATGLRMYLKAYTTKIKAAVTP